MLVVCGLYLHSWCVFVYYWSFTYKTWRCNSALRVLSKESLFNFTDVVYSLLLKVSCFAWLEKKKVYKNLFPQILYGFSNTLSVSAILFYSVYAITRASVSLRFAFYTVWKVSLFGVFLDIFSWIRTEYGEIQSMSPYSVRMRENGDRKKSEYRHFYAVSMPPQSLVQS